jgi:hypothetical protein
MQITIFRGGRRTVPMEKCTDEPILLGPLCFGDDPYGVAIAKSFNRVMSVAVLSGPIPGADLVVAGRTPLFYRHVGLWPRIVHVSI